MTSEWKETTLEDCTSLLGDGLHGTPQYTQNGEYAFVNGNNLVNGRIIIKPDTKRVNRTQFEKYKKELCDRTIMVSINGTLGNVALYNCEKIILGKSACYFNVLESVDKDFIRYVVSSPSFRTYLETNATGTTIKNISLKQMRDYSFYIPGYETQKRISGILRSIDDRISLNTAINENLEQQAQALFKSWFVDFEPFGGVMPDDWIETTLGDVTRNIRTKIGNNNTPVFSAVNSGNLVYSDDYFNKQVYSKDISKYIKVDNWDFAYNPARINIGSIGLNDLGVIGCVSPVYVVFSVQEDYHSFFRFFFRQKWFKQQSLTRASGSVRQTLNYSDFSLIDVIYPNAEFAKRFDDIWKSYYSVIERLREENVKLSELRDTLLPKLMNGEIDVSVVKI